MPAELGPDASIFNIKIGGQRLLTSNFIAVMDSLIEFTTYSNDAPAIVGKPKFVDKYHRDVLVSPPSLSLSCSVSLLTGFRWQELQSAMGLKQCKAFCQKLKLFKYEHQPVDVDGDTEDDAGDIETATRVPGAGD